MINLKLNIIIILLIIIMNYILIIINIINYNRNDIFHLKAQSSLKEDLFTDAIRDNLSIFLNSF